MRKKWNEGCCEHIRHVCVFCVTCDASVWRLTCLINNLFLLYILLINYTTHRLPCQPGVVRDAGALPCVDSDQLHVERFQGVILGIYVDRIWAILARPSIYRRRPKFERSVRLTHTRFLLYRSFVRCAVDQRRTVSLSLR
jgi:hypothetical protein